MKQQGKMDEHMKGMFGHKRRAILMMYKCTVAVLLSVICFLDVSYFIATGQISLTNVFADAGDFSIFRNQSNTTNVPGTGTEVDVVWDTIVSENANINLLSGSTTIDLIEGGKYLVLYNVWTQEGTGAGTNRRSLESYLSLAGTNLAYGRGDGYIRDSDNDLYAFNSGAAVIQANAGDDLQVHIARDDNNTSATTDIRAGTNGVSVIKLKDDFDYLRIYNDANSSDISGNTTFTDVTWGANDEIDTGSFGFTDDTTDITLKGNVGDYFLITTNVRLNQTANSGTRQNYESRLTLDGAEIPGTRVSAYPRGNANSNGIYFATLAYQGLIRKATSADETLNVEVRRESEAGATTNIVANETALTAVALPSTAHFVSLTSTSSQSLLTTRTPLDFDEQIEVEAAAFSHSTSSNASRINIDLDGDYLFFSTAYASRTNETNTARAVPQIEWRLDGSTLQTYGGHGSFNRGNQGTNIDSFTSGSSGGLVLSGLNDTQYVEVTAIEAINNSTAADYYPSFVAVQGVEMSLLFQTNVEVSATGTHAATTSIVTTEEELEGSFVITENTASRNVTNITITESGTVDGENGLDNIELYYDLDTTAPYDCFSESFSGTSTESKFGDTDETGFSGANGVSSFSGSVGISTTQTMCVYVVYDVVNAANDGETVLISIADPSNDVVVTSGGSVGPGSAVAPTASTTLQNAELTQTHYRWLEDDGLEGFASSVESEDVPATGFATGTIRRLRMQVDAAGSIDSLPTTYQLDYATKTAACSVLSNWDVVDGAGDWRMSDSTFITNGNNSTNIATTSGGLTDPAGATLLTSNGALRDTNASTSALTATSTQFIEFEFAVEPTDNAPQGTTYCFRLSDQDTALRNYDVFPEGTVSADITVSATGTQIVSVNVGTTSAYVGGTFVVERGGGQRTITDITITESGTVDAATGINNVALRYDLDTTAPYDCASESYSLNDTQFGATSTGGFSSANGTSTFSGSVLASSTQTMCAYLVMDVDTTAIDGETINVQINNPSVDVVVTSSSVGPSTAVEPTASTTINGPVLTQTGFHWRNDDGTESGASSASGDENVALLEVPKNSIRRLRVAISNEGSVTSQAEQYRLEYGTKVTTCSAVGSWQSIDVGSAFEMASTSQLIDGNNTTDISTTTGGITNPNTTFLSPNGGQKENDSQTGNVTLTSTEFVELEYALSATDESGFNTTYCFRVTASSTPLLAYDNYGELTTREKQDFFVQRGTETIGGTSTTLIAGIDYIAPSATSAAFVRITNSQFTGAGENADNDNNKNADGVTAYIEDASDITNSFVISRPSNTSNSINTRVSWEIVEYTGLPGADNEMVVRDVNTIGFGASGLVATGSAVNNVSDDSDIVVFITGVSHPDAAVTNYLSNLATADWATSTDEPTFERETSSGGVVNLSYAVVEYTGLNWQVQRVENNYATSTQTETQPINAVNSVTRTFIHAQKRAGDSGDNGLNDYGHQVWLSSIGLVSFRLEDIGNGVVTEHYSVAWVIENTQTGVGEMDVHRITGTVDASEVVEPRTSLVGIGATLGNLSNASLFITNDSSGDGTAYPRPMLGATIASTTDFELFESDAGQTQEYRVAIVEWPTAQLAFQQNYYRFYVDNDTITPTDPWPVGGASDLGENESITTNDDPLGESERIRIRMTVRVSNASFPELTQSFKLQYGRRDTASCSVINENDWFDVGGVGSSTIWRGYNATPADGTTLPSTLISLSDNAGTYEEENNSTVNPSTVAIGNDIEYDWLIEDNGATQRSDYCFRMVESDGTLLSAYNNYPTLRTTGFTPIISSWRWYDDATSTTPSTPLANEDTAPSGITNENEIKLRVSVAEVESAAGSNVKFALQYSQTSDFSGEVFFAEATSTCVSNSVWCYADGAGNDNDLIATTTISDADSCNAGVGSGCGQRNEASSTASTLTHPALATQEHEFTLRQAGARANGVYYFRLYDVGADEALTASSSFPSLSIAGPELTFTVEGLPSGTTTEGVTADVTTTANSIPFGTVPFDTEFEAAYRLRVDTGATEGYQMLMYARQPLLNTYGDEVPSVTGTNIAPLAWSSGCSVTASGCFGYHTGDDILAGGSTRFAPNDTYAAVSTTTPEEIMHSSVPTEDMVDVIYKLQVDELQAAGDYETDIVYLAVPVY